MDETKSEILDLLSRVLPDESISSEVEDLSDRICSIIKEYGDKVINRTNYCNY